jgi:hypothetical protein
MAAQAQFARTERMDAMTDEQNPKWSAGPGETIKHSWECTGIYSGDRRVAIIKIDDEVTEENQEELERVVDANAPLIAAAPDLFEALAEVMEWIDNWSPNFVMDDEWPDTQDKIEAVLAKAKGN